MTRLRKLIHEIPRRSLWQALAATDEFDATQENALETAQAALAADPSDYSVDAESGTIEVSCAAIVTCST